MVKNRCTHQCMSATKRGKQCKNRPLRLKDGNHIVIWFQNQWAEVCRLHWDGIFEYWISTGFPAATNEVSCE